MAELTYNCAAQLEQLRAAFDGAEEALILPHNDPDPDAVAAALALQLLLREVCGVEAALVYRGLIGRAENRAFVRYVGSPLRKLTLADLRRRPPLALVDTQPGGGNNALPLDYVPTAVFDHHMLRDETATATFADVRPEYGATSTMLTEYLLAAGCELSTQLSTALFYGIKTDTLGLGRGATEADIAAYFLHQRRLDVEALVEIERAQVPADYFKSFHATLETTRIYGQTLIAYAGQMSYPDLAAEMADLLLRLDGVRWVICMGAYKDTLFLAIRTRSRRGGAGAMVREIVAGEGPAGGHGQMAGGQIPLNGKDPEQVMVVLRQRALNACHITPEVHGEPLI